MKVAEARQLGDPIAVGLNVGLPTFDYKRES
jgi:hypothetical protein